MLHASRASHIVRRKLRRPGAYCTVSCLLQHWPAFCLTRTCVMPSLCTSSIAAWDPMYKPVDGHISEDNQTQTGASSATCWLPAVRTLCHGYSGHADGCCTERLVWPPGVSPVPHWQYEAVVPSQTVHSASIGTSSQHASWLEQNKFIQNYEIRDYVAFRGITKSALDPAFHVQNHVDRQQYSCTGSSTLCCTAAGSGTPGELRRSVLSCRACVIGGSL